MTVQTPPCVKSSRQKLRKTTEMSRQKRAAERQERKAGLKARLERTNNTPGMNRMQELHALLQSTGARPTTANDVDALTNQMHTMST